MAKTKTIKNAPILRTPITENEEVTIVLNLGKRDNFEIVYTPTTNKIQITKHDFVDGVDYFGSVTFEEE